MRFHRTLKCPNVKGKTIGEVLEEGKGCGVDLEKLDDLMLSCEIKNIQRNGNAISICMTGYPRYYSFKNFRLKTQKILSMSYQKLNLIIPL